MDNKSLENAAACKYIGITEKGKSKSEIEVSKKSEKIKLWKCCCYPVKNIVPSLFPSKGMKLKYNHICVSFVWV
jgi:hypothetical protein